MKAVVYNGPRDVAVKTVPDARIVKPTNVLVKITTTNICGSDLHMYEGRTRFEPGRIFGHENLGQVIEIGNAVERVKVGDLVCLPFNIGYCFCENCERGLTGFCLTANPGAAYDFAEMGPWDAARRNCSAFPMRISTASFCRRMPPRKRMTMSCYPTFSRPVGTPPSWQVCDPAIASLFTAPARLG